MISVDPIGWDDLLDSLLSLGLSLSSRENDVIAWLAWRPPQASFKLTANVHHGSLNRYFVELGFDSNALAEMSLEDTTDLLRGFTRIGENLWRLHDFYEGQVSPEETGPALSFVESKGVAEVRNALAEYNYARFLSPLLIQLAQLDDWLPRSHPKAEILPLARDGLLVIWDPSDTGTSRFLSLF